METLELKKQTRLKRKRRIRKKITGTAERPRLCVFRSAKHIYAQVVDDSTGRTLAAAGSLEGKIKGQSDVKGKIDVASRVGKSVGERAKKQGVQKVVFDRNGFFYHGRVKAVSDGAREAGLLF
ncbi:MAG: 50S ribosomal protein L18 [Thermodesulfobacteriota bacterium]|nr:50S ribosomal protein L18 [Thermodesulfobacteriota bacterium]